MNRPPLAAKLLLAVLATAAALVAPVATPAAVSADNPYQRGPAPTVQSIEATRGPYAVSEVSISELATSRLGSATIYYPTSTADGTFGVLSISPGFTA